ncbi:twin-arginine translocation signal domain-containing protein, partial [Microbacterium laevaniformans]|uniref:twin-arginine translocation signal domain-containing protein n=1 Tax=Microbacterium laevaniformans TaxID=36807 RepID=UPI0035E9853D
MSTDPALAGDDRLEPAPRAGLSRRGLLGLAAGVGAAGLAVGADTGREAQQAPTAEAGARRGLEAVVAREGGVGAHCRIVDV